MRREDLDAGPDVSPEEELATEISLYEQHQARQEVRRGDVRAIRARVLRLLPEATAPQRTTLRMPTEAA
jgi:hypothetical protein